MDANRTFNKIISSKMSRNIEAELFVSENRHKKNWSHFHSNKYAITYITSFAR